MRENILEYLEERGYDCTEVLDISERVCEKIKPQNYSDFFSELHESYWWGMT